MLPKRLQTLPVWLQKMNDFFSNFQVDLSELPKVEEVDFKPIDKKYLKVSLISKGILFLFLGAGVFALIYFNEDSDFQLNLSISLAYVGLLIWNITLTVLGFKKKKYAVRDRDVLYRKGLIWSVRTAIPFNRIQHAEIKQGPIERQFALSSLKIFTAGGQSSDLVIPGLPNETAQQLKDFILRKTSIDGA